MSEQAREIEHEVSLTSELFSDVGARPGRVSSPLRPETLATIVRQSLQEMSDALDCAKLFNLSLMMPERIFRVNATVGCTFTETDSPLNAALPTDRFPHWIANPFSATHHLQNAEGLPPPLPLHSPGGKHRHPRYFSSRLSYRVACGTTQTECRPHNTTLGGKGKQVVSRAALLSELIRASLAYQDELRLRYATRDLTASILEGCPIEEIGESLTAMIARLFHEDRAALYLNDERGRTQPIYLRNLSREYGQSTARLAPHSPIVARAIQSGEPFHIRDVQTDPEMPPQKRFLFKQEAITSLLVAPLQFAETVYGTLAVYPRTDREFSKGELAIFQSFADMATLGVALSRQLEGQKRLATIEERNRLAREMHDTVAQALAGLSIQLETAQNHLANGQLPAAEEILKVARQSSRHALEETRRAVQNLGASSLEQLTPPQALAAETERFQSEQKIAAQFLQNGEEKPLSSEIQLAVLRIAQEALSNAAKYANASRVRVGLQYLAEEIALLIEDDGAGFDVEACAAPGPEGGYGLFGMRERARLLGGELTIESTPNWGTRIRARLPYINPLTRTEPRSQVVVPMSSFPTLVPAQFYTSPTPPLELSLPAPQIKPTSQVLRVLIADDHQVTRQGVKLLLEATGEITVVAEANDGLEALQLIEEHVPDVALFDLNMPNLDGIETLRRLHDLRPELPVVIFTSFPTDETLRAALKAGAKGYLKKDAASREIVSAIHAAFSGEITLGQDATSRLAALADRGKEDTLPERALEVLQLLAQGARNKEIAAKLFISERTVEYHLSTLFTRLNVSNRTEAVRVGLDRGLIGK